MSKRTEISGILVLVVILMIAISTWMVVTYSTGVLTSAVAFASSNPMSKFIACGITPPQELFKLQADIPTILLPGVYVGFPGLMVLISILMFIAGYYYGNEKGDYSSSETTTTRSPVRGEDGARYDPGTRIEETRTQKTSRSERN